MTEDRLLKAEEVQAITAVSKATLYRLISSGQFPKPLQVGPQAVRWRLSDIDSWMSALSTST